MLFRWTHLAVLFCRAHLTVLFCRAHLTVLFCRAHLTVRHQKRTGPVVVTLLADPIACLCCQALPIRTLAGKGGDHA